MKKILVADDDDSILEPLSLILEQEGYEVATESKGEHVYKKALAYQADLILLDILMSGVDGRAVCRKLKNDSAISETPVVLMSAYPSIQHIFSDCGADGYIEKPFEVSALLKSVEMYVSQEKSAV